MIIEAGGDKTAAVKAYESLARREQGELPGALASSRYQTLTGKLPAPDETTKRLASLAAGVPSWLESMIENPRRIQTIEAKLESDTLHAVPFQ